MWFLLWVLEGDSHYHNTLYLLYQQNTGCVGENFVRPFEGVGARTKHDAPALGAPKHSSVLCTKKDSLTRHGLGSEADRLKVVSRCLLTPMVLDTDFDSSPADPTAAGHLGIR